MTDDRHSSEPEARSPYSALRAWEPARDPVARGRAQSLLQLRIDGARIDGAPQPHAASSPRRGRRPRLPRRWLAPAIALVVVAGAGGALAAVLLRTENTARLAVFTAQGKLAPRFHVGARGSGYCWELSIAANTKDAYRCFQGNLIEDPCFAASTHAHVVYCFFNPWARVTVLRLTRPLPKEPPLKGPVLPWAIVTTSGLRCVFLTGGTALVADQRINYGCTNGSYLIGAPNTRSPLWTIHSVRHFESDQMHAPISTIPTVAIRQTIG